jgi:hypothetical protein
VSATEQCGHWQTWPHLRALQRARETAAVEEQDRLLAFFQTLFERHAQLVGKIAGPPLCLAASRRMSTTRTSGIDWPSARWSRRSSRYLPACELCHDSSEGVAEPSTIAQPSKAARSTATSRP